MFSYIPSLHPITGHDSSENDLEDIFETGTRGLKTGGGSLCLRNSKRRISVFWKLSLPEIEVMEKGSIEQAISRFRTKVLRGTCNTCGNPMYIQKSISQRPEMLMLQLNRQDDQGNKLDDEIKFEDLVIDKRFMNYSADVQYELTSVMMHIKTDINGPFGHCMVAVKGKADAWAHLRNNSPVLELQERVQTRYIKRQNLLHLCIPPFTYQWRQDQTSYIERSIE
ncbi:uncharacterized protein N7529_002917 [Penicillium soppii]|uniref:uncharacterized protein n=1 Tax=Penicillium soppii TaxID=69789 RepID=UPI002546C68D|nr:uncharacterized protein N7529_002917 [Penicillium soppii]KAJ5874487.1 hypothetical protein N7529_002917 [Penicillium soppii]